MRSDKHDKNQSSWSNNSNNGSKNGEKWRNEVVEYNECNDIDTLYLNKDSEWMHMCYCNWFVIIVS